MGKQTRYREAIDPEEIVESDVPLPPDGGWGWVIVFASLMCNVILDGFCFSFGVMYLQLLNQFGESKMKTAWAGSLLTGCYLTMGPITGALSNKFGFRAITIVGSFFASGAFVASIFSPNLNVLILTYGILGGIGFGLIYLPSIAIVGFWFQKRRALATGIAVCGSGIGTFIFSPLAQALINTYDWRGCILILSGIVLNCAVCGALFRPLEEQDCSTKITMMQRIKKMKDQRMNEESEFGSIHHLSRNGPVECHSRRSSISSNQSRENTSFLSPPNARYSQEPTGGSRALTFLEDSNLARNSNSRSAHCLTSSNVVDKKSGTCGKNCDRQRPVSSIISKRFSMTPDMVTLEEGKTLAVDVEYAYDPHDIWIRKSQLDLEKKLDRMRKLSHDDVARPFYRQDIFYSGSILHLPEYTSVGNVSDYMKSNLNLPSVREDDAETGSRDYSEHRCSPLVDDLRPITDVLFQMLNFTLLKSPLFCLLCLSSVLAMLGFFIPFVYISNQAIMKGIDDDSAVFLVSILGITNTIGRVVCGYISDHPKVDCIQINNWALVVAGVSTACCPLCSSYSLLALYSSIFGVCIACFVALRSIILVELLGLHKLTSSLGILLLFQGVATMIGSPIAGYLADLTGDNDLSFYMGGAVLALSGIICFPIRRLARWEQVREAKNAAKIRVSVAGADDTPRGSLEPDVYVDRVSAL